MKKVLFVLSMPSNNSWNGKWSGAEKNYTRTVNLSEKFFKRIGLNESGRSWSYNFGDGWCAMVTAHIIQPGVRVKKSDGFCGYDWMVDSILSYGEILNDSQRKERAKTLNTTNAMPGTGTGPAPQTAEAASA